MNRLILTGHQSPERSSIHSSPDGDRQHMQSSVFAEYPGMLLCVHAVFCAFARLLLAANDVSVIPGIVGCAWVALRVIPVLRWRWTFLLVTTGCTVLLIWSESGLRTTSLPLVGRGPFSTATILIMLVLVFTVDLASTIKVLNRHLQSQKLRRQLHAVLTTYGLPVLLCGLAGSVVVYSIAVPLAQEAIHQHAGAPEDAKLAFERMTVPQNMLFRFSELMSALWFFVAGCCVGSFLNVVIFRVPAGISVLAQASHCPTCKVPIVWRDNLPVVGWLKLKGRCRNCKTPISPRYPSIELTTGILFLLLYFVELISGGMNLPGRNPNVYAGVLWILFYTQWGLLGLYVFHCFVLCAVFSWAMIGRDGYAVPGKVIAVTTGLVAGMVLIWPHLLPWKNDPLVPSIAQSTGWTSLIPTVTRILEGSVVGYMVGLLSDRICGLPKQSAIWLLIGLAFGWQAVIGISLLFISAHTLMTLAETLSNANATVGCVVNVAVTDAPTHNSGTRDTHYSDTSAPAWSWWLLPTALMIHHCMWRQLALNIGLTL